MILLSELSRRRIRSINKLIRVGKDEVVMVIRVDKEKGYIDLSKRRVAPEDVKGAEDRYAKAKAAHAIIRHVSNRLHTPMLSLYKRIGWPLQRKYGHAADAFQLAVHDPDTVLSGLEITEAERSELLTHIRTKMTPHPLKIRADIQVTCFTYEGVEAIRAALLAGEALSSEAVPIKVRLIAAPIYVMHTTTLDKVAGVAALEAAVEAVKKVIESKGGQLVVKMAPIVTSSQEDSELDKLLNEGDDSDVEDADGEEDNEEGMGSGEIGGPGLGGDFDVAASYPSKRASSSSSSSSAAASSNAGASSGRGSAGPVGAGAGADPDADGDDEEAESGARGGDAGASGSSAPAPTGGASAGALGVAVGASIDFGKKKKKGKTAAVIEEDD